MNTTAFSPESTSSASPPALEQSLSKAVVVDVLCHLFECSPALARLAGRLVLRAWPNMRET
jgi:hypothetical protein